MLDDFQSSQELAYSLVTNSLAKDKIFHAYLFNGNGWSNAFDFVLAFAKSIFCDKHFLCKNDSCLSCNICDRIDNCNYSELKIIESDSNVIKKEQLLELQSVFSLSSVEGIYRIYIIRDCDKMNKQASNSLLKFLEEPTDGLIAILLTNNINNLLRTIISRCQVVNLINDNKYSDISSVMNYGLFCCNVKDNIDSFVSDEVNINFINDVLKFLLYFENNGLDTLVFIKNLWYNKFKLREESINAFLLMMYFYYDVLRYKLGFNKFFFCDRIESISEISSNNSVEDIIKKINLFNYGYDMATKNLNINLLINDIIIRLGE